jgi:flagellar basal-body rod modification protein FlgD
MATTAISGTTNAASTQMPTTRGFNDLGGEDFVALLIAELQAQDPLKPADNKEIVAQMANIRQMEQSETLNSALNSLAAEQRFGSTAGLIGHYVTGTVTDSSGKEYQVEGVVTSVRYEKGKAILELHNGLQLPAEKVDQVTLLENLPTDKLAQLEQEMNAAAGDGSTTPSGDTGTGGAKSKTSAARVLPSRFSPASLNASGVIRGFGRQADQTATLLESMFGPQTTASIR